MELDSAFGRPIDLADGGALFEDVFLSVWRGEADNDGYNGLAQTAGLWSREIAILRAYGRYLQQAGIPQSQDFIAAALNRYPDIARGLLPAVRRAVRPGRARTATVAAKHLKAKIKDALEDVPNIDDDTIIRRYLNLIEASLRTNHFVAGHATSGPVAGDQARFARASTACRSRSRGARSSSTAPRSRACICASARWRAAACAGRTARRTTAPRCSAWSRRSRSRTPSSCRSAPRAASSRSACRRAAAATRSSRPARSAYVNFVSSLLSITDNIDGDGVVPPAGVVRRDARRSLFRRRRRQGHGDLLRHRQRHQPGARLLARRRLRLGRLGRLRPQEDGHHRQGRLGSGQAAFPRDEPRHPDRALHRRRRRRHVGRRVRQRHAAVGRRRG